METFCIVPLIQHCTVYDFENYLGFHVAVRKANPASPIAQYLIDRKLQNKWTPAQAALQTESGKEFFIVSAFMINDAGSLSEATILKHYECGANGKPKEDIEKVCAAFNR